ncbi:alpha-(1,3)-fucosyltransferase 7 [Dicentrarchus labrax]|uniref:alpha-(1,3)-fucosyltransferase 7 n=1 Tax=Dicentrarchus labrax TaxID=13489 RepID=UPI0021F651E5|nr:alpha-(1,3)-fucosyltransferase 7 [Dicentrarchus labrax]XP_051268092.1 alpha-(1,3)-fucosyltransferase 7 [Dicentrarchus labrax]XP_051268093.1 alpha-(1,3)-fucosyltransferase 7 [Dicentrarchus labrax]XP_051268094.1 alpha-(1,3)-fucosyltransferase 7 [Dicentrarchus labrax]
MKKYLLLFFLSVFPLCLLNGWPTGFQSLPAINPSTFSSTHRNVTILLWYWPFNRPFSLRGDVCWDLYRIPGCRLVDQRSLFPSADVVVFHNRELVIGHQKLPFDLPRPQGQRWAWMSLEAPLYNGNLRNYGHIFNMTITYRRDADITVPYGELLPKVTEEHLQEDSPLNKTSLVCWVVSNYRSQHKRSQVYKQLNATVPVKVYGRWTKRPLPSKALLPTISRCYFYLAFENSVGKDYITEKLWRNAYLSGAVPVVLGPPLSDYKAVAPPNSLIHVDEFASVKDLGKYLQQLAMDKKRYNEYFTWKHQWKVKLYTDWRERLCKICSQYNSLPQQKVYSDLEAWVSAPNT